MSQDYKKEKEHPWDEDISDLEPADDSQAASEEDFQISDDSSWVDQLQKSGGGSPSVKNKEKKIISPCLNQPITVRSMTEAAMMVGIAVILGVLGSYIPILSFLGPLFFPLPIVVLVFRHGLKIGIIGSVCVGLLLTILLNPVLALVMMVQFALMGLFFGYCFRMNRKPLFTLVGGTIIAAFGTVLNLILTAYIAGLPMEGIYTQFEEIINVFVATAEKTGALSSILPAGMTIEAYRTSMLDTMKKILPGALIAASMMMATINYLIFSYILRRLNFAVPSLPKFTDWKLDWKLLWGMILALVLTALGNWLKMPILLQAGVNILYIFYPLLLVCGLSLLFWIFSHWQLSYLIKIAFFFLLFSFFNVTISVLMLAAIFDPLIDFRAKMSKFFSK